MFNIDYNSVYQYNTYMYDYIQSIYNERDNREDKAIKNSKELQCKIDKVLEEIECMVREHKLSETIGLKLKDMLKGSDENE